MWLRQAFQRPFFDPLMAGGTAVDPGRVAVVTGQLGQRNLGDRRWLGRKPPQCEVLPLVRLPGPPGVGQKHPLGWPPAGPVPRRPMPCAFAPCCSRAGRGAAWQISLQHRAARHQQREVPPPPSGAGRPVRHPSPLAAVAALFATRYSGDRGFGRWGDITMAWPRATDYCEAVQNLRVSMVNEELRKGRLECDSLGLPMLWAGNFANVYKVHCPATGNTWALKCFTREVRGLQERYPPIAAHLDQVRLPFTVDFQYLDRGIRVGGQAYPMLKMRWVEGLSLTQFVEEHLERPRNLKMLLDLWVRLAARLREARVAHADLQHGNVLLVPVSGNSLALRLIDYNGMYVPPLAGTRSGELGHPAYQHPDRLSKGIYNAEVDRFSHLTIYGEVRSLMVGRRELWDHFNNGDNLLFRESDFHSPERSTLFRAIWDLGDADARAIAGRLVLACLRPLEAAPLLEEDGHRRRRQTAGPRRPGGSRVDSAMVGGQGAGDRGPRSGIGVRGSGPECSTPGPAVR